MHCGVTCIDSTCGGLGNIITAVQAAALSMPPMWLDVQGWNDAKPEIAESACCSCKCLASCSAGATGWPATGTGDQDCRLAAARHPHLLWLVSPAGLLQAVVKHAVVARTHWTNSPDDIEKVGRLPAQHHASIEWVLLFTLAGSLICPECQQLARPAHSLPLDRQVAQMPGNSGRQRRPCSNA